MESCIFTIVGKIGAYLVGPIGEQFGYIIFYKSNIAILEDKIRKLREKQQAVQQSIDDAQRKRKVVSSEVKTWLANVEKKNREAQKFLDEEDVEANRMCLNVWCPDLKLRYSLGKEAQKNTQAIDDLLKDGEKYDLVYYNAPPLKIRSSSINQLFKDFESRKSTIQNILNALKNDNIGMIALCGMGGMGKTKMAEEIKRRVESDNLFHKVAIAVVSQNPNFIKIQGELAESLGTRLKAENLRGRAEELYSILTENKKVLLILDDVWKQLDNEDIEDIGVYYAFKEKSCKILLTSRNKEPCNGIEIQETFRVDPLSEEEAWNIFVEMAGDCVNRSDLILIAKQVAKECAGSPLAIATVGGALRNKSDKNEWKAALQQLKMSIPQNINGQLKVYSNIEFSYNYLESDEAKSCFLLCCLYPEDYYIQIEDLVRYGVAKRFLKGVGTVEQTRELVHTIVKNLRRVNLLLDSNVDEFVKMHDLVRDVAISIASRNENGFMLVLHEGLEEWPQLDRYDSYTAISLLLGEMKWHPTELKCPKLQLLRLSCLNDSNTFPDNLFDGMKELKMLSLQQSSFSLTTLPPSIQILQNLQMLNLENCHLGDVSAIGTLGNLEILGFRNSQIEELPSEIGNLSRLKLLDMMDCDFDRIAAGALSGLSRLEELYVGEFKKWGCTMAGNVTIKNASLDELIPYSNQLVVLEISVPSIFCLPKELDFSNSNFRFMIDIGVDDFPNGRYLFENTLKLKEEDASYLGEYRIIRSLLKNAIVLELDIAKNLKHIWFEKEQKGIVPSSLKFLRICRCQDLKYLSEATLDTSPANTFHLLKSLSLHDLPRLIGICNSTDSVEVGEGGNNASTTVTHKLFSSNTILWVPNLEILEVGDCRSLKVVFDLEGIKVKENCKPILSVLSSRDIKGFNYLRLLQVRGCNTLKCLFTPSIAKLLVKLEEIEVYGCNEMEEILAKELGDEENRDVIAFPLVKTLKLENLRKLECFYTEDNHAFEWPSLNKIKICGCPRLKMFVSTSTKTPKLKGVHMRFEENPQPMVEGDLNATIQHIIKGKGFNQFSPPVPGGPRWLF